MYNFPLESKSLPIKLSMEVSFTVQEIYVDQGGSVLETKSPLPSEINYKLNDGKTPAYNIISNVECFVSKTKLNMIQPENAQLKIRNQKLHA